MPADSPAGGAARMACPLVPPHGSLAERTAPLSPISFTSSPPERAGEWEREDRNAESTASPGCPRSYARRVALGVLAVGLVVAAWYAAARAPSGISFDEEANICLFTIMTQERLASLHRMLTVWDGWVSIAMLVDDYATASSMGLQMLSYDGRLPPLPERITLSLVEDRGYREPFNRFPYNVLRNVALSRCHADYVMAVDVDFVPFPAPSPSRRLRRHLLDLDVRAGSPNVIALAAFEQVEGASSSAAHLLLDKPQLQRLVGAREVIGFASAVYDAGHRCDHVDRFLSTAAAYEVAYEFGCEPYVLLPRAMAHPYEERFVGYGKDRVSWNYELAAKGARFVVPADAFLVHFNTYDKPQQRGASKRQYGHFPTDWMLGESCWPSFRDRVQRQYNYSLYTCHQRNIDQLQRHKFEQCVAEAEQLCVAPYCSPAVTTVLTRGGRVQSHASPHALFPRPPPPPPPPRARLAPREPGLLLVGCEACGVPELWRTLLITNSFAPAAVEPGEPSWRDRQVHYFDHEARYMLGHAWYQQRWLLADGARLVAVDGSSSYLHSALAAARAAASLAASTLRLVLLRDPYARALRRWRDLSRRQEATRGVSFDAKLLAETSALSRCFDDAAEGGALRPAAWERCVAVACGRYCVMGEGVYPPQLVPWRPALVLPEDAFRSPAAAPAALRRVFAALSLPPPPSLPCAASQLSAWLSANDSSAAPRPPPPHAAAAAAGRAFFSRYNAPLLALVDAPSLPLWREAAWANAPPPSPQQLRAALAALRAHVAADDAPPPIGAARWFGGGPRPSVFLLGARDASAEGLAEFLLSQPGVCGGPLRLFDDDSRYANGLAAAAARFTRRPHNASARRASACATLVDTTPYLHTRWAAPRIHATLAAERASLRFLVVLRDPTERAVRHWRSLQASVLRASRHAKRDAPGAPRPSDAGAYVNGSSLLKKAKHEAAQMAACLAAAPPPHSAAAWARCTTLACNWAECITSAGLYAPQLRGWFDYFPREQFLFLDAALLHAAPHDAAARVAEFLRFPPPADGAAGARDNSSMATVGEQLKRVLHRFYAEHNRDLRQLLGESYPSAPWL
ncbi:hypothetical protein AB1Y20_016524 [Prymnesium parvum]|uniref:Protein-tyrosine sulfotransferase n=1 Tax=Prymnesium parvum TaxID=97485 RepID=A0AB34ICM4_PRYPA